LTGLGVAFDSTVNGAYALTVTNPGMTTFNGVVGGTTNLTSLLVTGSTTIHTTDIKTTGTQEYVGPVALTSDTVLTGLGLTFDSTVNGAYALTVTNPGMTTFNGAVGASINGPLGSIVINSNGLTTFNSIVNAASFLQTGALGTIAINGGNVTTSGIQTYSASVVLGVDTSFNAGTGAITFSSTVDGAVNMMTTTSGGTQFAAAVGGVHQLTGLTINTGTLSATAIGMSTTANTVLSITNSGAGTITDVISGHGVGFSKAGLGQLTLFGANTYVGSTTVVEGVLQAGSNSLLNTELITSGPIGLGNLVVLSGATFDLNGKSVANVMSIVGPGFAGNGALINSDVSNEGTYSGAVTLAGNTKIGGVGTTNISGFVNAVSYGLTFLDGSFNLSNAENTLNTISANGVGSLAVRNSTQFSVGTTNLVTGLQTRGNISFFAQAGNNIAIMGAITAGGTINIDPTDITISAPITAPTVILTGTGSITQSAPITATNLILNASGTYNLSQNNAISGSTTVTNGATVLVSNNNAFGAGSVALNTVTLQSAGPLITLNNAISLTGPATIMLQLGKFLH
jgi:autotransporter-associated beta strand protein